MLRYSKLPERDALELFMIAKHIFQQIVDSSQFFLPCRLI